MFQRRRPSWGRFRYFRFLNEKGLDRDPRGSGSRFDFFLFYFRDTWSEKKTNGGEEGEEEEEEKGRKEKDGEK